MELSLAEILLIVVVAAIAIGPKELPVVIRAVAKAMRALRGFAADIRKGFDQLAEESGLEDDLKPEIRMIKGDDGTLYESYDLTQISAAKRGE